MEFRIMNIKNEIQYQAALSRANYLMNLTHRGISQNIEFNVLVDNIVEYEHSIIEEDIETNAVKSNT